jgi:hypothetical protein
MKVSDVFKKPEIWYPMSTAPMNSHIVTVKMRDGSVKKAHWACNLSGEEQPAFQGWFATCYNKYGSVSYNYEIDTPIVWRPILEKRELYVEIITMGTKEFVIASHPRKATKTEIDCTVASFGNGKCDHGVFYDEPGFAYDMRICGVCGHRISLI